MKNHYMVVSAVLLLLSFIPFALLYEKKKPRAREIVLLAMMSAITVVSNLICAYTVPFHAGTAMVILTGIALGPEAGFLTGALARFLCNFFMGQGIWTPWEMISWAILGALAGTLFYRVELTSKLQDQKQRAKQQRTLGMRNMLPVISCIAVAQLIGYFWYLFLTDHTQSYLGWRVYVFGIIGILAAVVIGKRRMPVTPITMTGFTFFSVFIIYGGIMNLASYFMNNAVGSGSAQSLEDAWNAIQLLYITGVPYDVFHALGASVCVFLLGDSMTQKLTRIQIKFGMYQKIQR